MGHFYHYKNFIIQVYLVTGGTDGITGALTSTEILVSGAESWTEVAGQLPKPLMGLRKTLKIWKPCLKTSKL